MSLLRPVPLEEEKTQVATVSRVGPSIAAAARAALADERNREVATLAAPKAERASVAAKGWQIETEAAPIQYVAQFLGLDTDSERAIRWLIADGLLL